MSGMGMSPLAFWGEVAAVVCDGAGMVEGAAEEPEAMVVEGPDVAALSGMGGGGDALRHPTASTITTTPLSGATRHRPSVHRCCLAFALVGVSSTEPLLVFKHKLVACMGSTGLGLTLGLAEC
ncbi:MAG: hypothetical protein AAFX99_14835 [Myxococcota bacterium]